MELREQIIQIIVENLRAAEMRQGNTNHTQHAINLADQIIPIIQKSERERIADALLKQGTIWVDKIYSFKKSLK